jgi:CBS domain-containing protein
MSPELRSIHLDASLREAGRLMQQWKTGSLLVTDSKAYVGLITDSALARDVVAKGLDPNTTTVKACMRTPLVAIRGDRPLIDAVRMMKEQATRHRTDFRVQYSAVLLRRRLKKLSAGRRCAQFRMGGGQWVRRRLLLEGTHYTRR